MRITSAGVLEAVVGRVLLILAAARIAFLEEPGIPPRKGAEVVAALGSVVGLSKCDEVVDLTGALW